MFIERFAVACLTRTIHPRIALVNPLRVPTPPEGGVGEPTGGPHTSPATPATPRCSAPRWRSCSSPSRTATSRRPTRRRRRPRTAPPTARRRPAASDLRRALVLASAPVGRWLLHMKRRARRALAVTDLLSHTRSHLKMKLGSFIGASFVRSTTWPAVGPWLRLRERRDRERVPLRLQYTD